MGLIMLGLGFAVMIVAAQLVVRGDTVLPTWLIFTYLLHTMGELALSPVGLSAVTRLSPRRYVGQMMGAWFLSASLGSILAGLIAGEFRADAVETMPSLYTADRADVGGRRAASGRCVRAAEAAHCIESPPDMKSCWETPGAPTSLPTLSNSC